MQARIVRQLRRGQLRPHGTLDLHGLTADEASSRLADFLHASVAADRRVVCIVHGKGRGSGGRGPVLKALINRWLRTRNEVLAFCSAQPRDGGTGALYVLLRRSAGA